MFRIAVCDDEEIICAEIEHIVLDFCKQSSENIIVEVFFSGEELCKFLKKGEVFDLLFLDIELKGINGAEVGRIIRDDLKNEAIQIIYISAHDSYYQELFEVRPMHFLHKPLVPEKIIKDVEKAIDLVEKLGNTFCYQQGHYFYRKMIKDILYFEANGRQVKMIGKETESCFYGSISEINQKLSKYHFFPIHKSFLINYAHVIKFGQKEVIMSNDDVLPISRNKCKEVMQQLFLLEKEGE